MDSIIPSTFTVNLTFNDITSIMYIVGLFIVVFLSFFFIKSFFQA